jgi:uncharacterized GH25 family protein
MTNTLKGLVALCAMAMVSQASAHFLWLEFPEQPGEVHLGFTETPGRKTRETLQDKVKGTAVTNAAGEAVAMEKAEGALKGKMDQQDAASGSLCYGVLDRSGEGRGVFLLRYHAKAASNIAQASRKLGLPVEVVAEQTDDGIKVQVLKDGAPAPGAELTLSRGDTTEEQELEADEQGTALIPAPAPGLSGIRAMVAEEKSGEHDGQAYTLVRHYSTLTFRTPAP